MNNNKKSSRATAIDSLQEREERNARETPSETHDEEAWDYFTMEAVRIRVTAGAGGDDDLFHLVGCNIKDTLAGPALTESPGAEIVLAHSGLQRLHEAIGRLLRAYS